MVGKEARVLISSLVGAKLLRLSCIRFLGALCNLQVLYSTMLRERGEDFSMSNHPLNITMSTTNERPPDIAIV